MDPRVTRPLCKPEALPGVPALALLAPDGASCWAGKGPLSSAGTLSSCLGPGSPVLSTNLRAMLDQTIVNLLFFFLHLVEDGVCVSVCVHAFFMPVITNLENLPRMAQLCSGPQGFKLKSQLTDLVLCLEPILLSPSLLLSLIDSF